MIWQRKGLMMAKSLNNGGKKDAAQDKQMVKRGVGQHETAMHKGKRS